MALQARYEGSIAWLELDHGKANEMGRAQIGELEALCAELEGRPERVLVTTSRRLSKRGTPIFVAGANVTERADWSDDEIRAHVRRQRAALARLRRVPQFHIAVVHGAALGWGTELMIACDYRIATPGAVFGLPETGLGIVPGAGGASELVQLIGVAQTLRLGMTGERVDAQAALAMGLVQEVVPDLDAGLARARALAALTETRSPTAVAAFKAAVLGGLGLDPQGRQALEARAYEHCLDSGDAAVGRANFEVVVSGGVPPWGGRKPFEP